MLTPLSLTAQTFPPYTGTVAITIAALPVPAGTSTIALPTATGTNFVEVKGDQTKNRLQCQLARGEWSADDEVQYLRAGFPN